MEDGIGQHAQTIAKQKRGGASKRLIPEQTTSSEDSTQTESGAAIAPPDKPATYREVFEIREYRYLFAAYVLSLMGDQLSKIALSFLVFSISDSAGLAAAAFAVSYLPWIVGGPLLATYADRAPRRTVLITCDVARAALVGLLAVPGIPVPALICVLLIANLFSPPFLSARAAMMPEVMEGDRYVVANGLDNIVNQVGQVAGFAIGGALVMLLSARGALLADATTFLISAGLIALGVRARPAAAAKSETKNSRVFPEMLAVSRFIFTDPRLRAYLLLFWLASAFVYAAEGLAPPLAKELHGGPRLGGVLLAAAPLGVALGGLLLGRLCPPSLRLRLIMPLALLSCAVLIPTWFGPPIAVMLALLFIAGLGSSFTIPLNPMFARAVPSEIRGRAFGVAVSGVNAAQGIAIIGSGAIVDLYGWAPTTVIAISGLIGTLVVLAIAAIWPHPIFRSTRQ